MVGDDLCNVSPYDRVRLCNLLRLSTGLSSTESGATQPCNRYMHWVSSGEEQFTIKITIAFELSEAT